MSKELRERIRVLEEALLPFAREAIGMNAPSPSCIYVDKEDTEFMLTGWHVWDAHVALWGTKPNPNSPKG